MSPESAAWSATANSAWLHITSGYASGTGSTNILFTFDVNSGATRSGTLTIADETLTVTQAGTNHIASTLVTTLVASGLSSPTSIATDSAGNVYIADRNSSTIKKWTAANNTVTTLVPSGLSLPNAVAVDAVGDVYIADSGNDAIKKLTITNNTLTTLVSNGLNNPYGVAVDAVGNVFISDSGNNALKKWSVTDSNVITLVSSGLNGPIGLATDISGNVFIADTFNQAIKKWTAATSNIITLVSSGLNVPAGVAVDGAGNVYIANASGQNIRKWTAATGVSTTIASTGLVAPNGVAVDSAGNIYIASTGNNTIRELPRAFVDTTTRLESAVAGSESLQIALPTSVNLLPPFAPTSNQPWLTISNTSNGVVTVTFTNNFGNSRNANLTVLGLTVPITQAAPTFTLATNAASVGAAPGTNSVALVTLPEGASWTATNNATWLHLASGFTNGAGSTNIIYTFDVNSGAQRMGTLTIAGQTFTVTQAAPPLPEIGVEQPTGANLVDGSATNNFGNGYVGFTNTINTFVITNSGTTNLAGLAITKDGAHAADFIVSAVGSATLAPNTSTTFNVSFVPKATGNRNAAIHIANSDPDENPFDIALTGFAIAPSNTLSSTSISVSFIAGSSNVSLTVTPEIATWTATANAAWLYLSAANQSGTGSTNIAFTFDANPGAQRIGTLTLAGQTLTVTQAALPVPEIGVQQPIGTNLTDDSATNNFGTGYVGFTNTINTFVITNSGTTNLAGIAITKDGAHAADFIVSAVRSATLAPSASTTFTVSFVPTASGNRTAAIHITSNDKDENPFDVALTGFAMAPSNTLNSTSHFVSYLAGSSNVSLTVAPEIANWTATANTAWLQLSPPNQSGTGSATVTFTFDANPGAQRIGSLTIAGQTLTVTQAGLPTPEISVQQPIGSSLTDGTTTNNLGNSYLSLTNTITTFVITNSGTTNLTSLAITKDGANAGDFIVSAIGVMTLAPNASTTFTVSFAPTATGSRTAAIHIANNDADENPFDIALTGFGVAPIYSLSTTTSSVAYLAGSNSITLTVTPETATWTATANSPWLHLNPANQIGTGSSNLVFFFDINPGAEGVGTLTIAGQAVTVTQAALPFTAALGTTNIVAGPSAGTDSVVLFIQPVTSSNWTATANAPWLHLSAPNQSGSSSANVIFTFDANTGATRTGTLSIAGQTLFVTQGGTNVLSAGSLTTLAPAGFNQPKGVAVDGAGNLYIADTSNNAIKKWTRSNNTVSTLISGLNQPGGVALDSSGNVFIADTQNFAIKKWTASNSTVTTVISSGLNRPAGVAVDTAGNLYIADTYNNAIKKWTATNNTLTTLVSSGLDLPNGVAVDASGNVYIADTFFKRVKKWTAANQTVTIVISTGLIQPHGVAVDASGNIYVADTFNHSIKKWTVTSGAVTTLISGLNLPKGVTADESGNVFVADTSNNQIKELPRAFVDTSPRVFNTPASTNSIFAVLPTNANLLPPFAPTSSQAWLTINSVSNGVINIAVTANTSASRTANLAVLNRTIPITQTLIVTPPTLGYSKIVAGLALNFAANPGQIYQIESAPAVTGPWITNTSLTGSASGILNYPNPISTVSNRFFRTRTP